MTSVDFGIENAYLRIQYNFDNFADDFKLRLIENYEIFLSIRADKSDSCSPSDLIDMLWHSHILDTKNYYDYCMSKFGKIIHHNPDDSLDQTERLTRISNTMSEITKSHALDSLIWNIHKCNLCGCHVLKPKKICEDCNAIVEQNNIESLGKPKFTIYIKTLYQKTYEIEACDDMLVYNLALQFARNYYGGHVESIRLIFNKQLMLNKKTLKNYGIKQNDEITFVPRIVGC